MASLRKENNDLKSRLDTIQRSFDQLLDITAKSGPSKVDLNRIQSLRKIVEDTWPIPALEEDESLNTKLNTNSGKDSLIHSEISDDLQSHKPPVDDAGQNNPSKPPYFQDSLTEFFDMVPTHSAFKTLKTPYTWKFKEPPSASIPFILRLKYEGLKRGYNIITSQETPVSLVFRTFKHTMFSESKERILGRIQYLLRQSTELIYQAASGNGKTFTYVSPLESEQLKKSLQFFESPNQLSLDSTAQYPTSSVEPDVDDAELDHEDRYIDLDSVERYLLNRGLNIETGSKFVSMSARTALQNTSSPTLFEEIRGGQELKLSVGKLLNGE